jgi:nitrate/nitrite-specific signal transduction histidine kinase
MPIAPTTTDILVSFAPVPDSVRGARHALRDQGLHPDLDHTVSLLTSEVMGNAVRHARPSGPGDRIAFHAQIDDDRVRIAVSDPGQGFDPEVRHDAAGYGLRLLDELAARWGVDCTPRGCRVWFEVDRHGARFLPAPG